VCAALQRAPAIERQAVGFGDTRVGLLPQSGAGALANPQRSSPDASATEAV